jgi:hypothetical protein
MRAAMLCCVVLCAGCEPTRRESLGGLCAELDPRPDACLTSCDPNGDSCPDGFHCFADGMCDADCRQGFGECAEDQRCTPDGRCVGADQCNGLECNIVECGALGQPLTSLTGKVFAPNGTLPLYGVNVYIPNAPLPAFEEGAVCDRCSAALPGSPLSVVQTDADGNFTLTNVPAGVPLKVVITTGKWRKVVEVPSVAQCENTNLTTEQTRLPRNRSEGDMPRIAITTGAYDALECLVRKLGVDDTEIATDGTDARIHLYQGNGVAEFAAGFPGGSGTFPSATPMWSSLDRLKTYDIVMMSCEGQQHPETKSQAAMDAMKAYADLGGRAFMTHWHNIWIEGATYDNLPQRPAVWTGIATWDDTGTTIFTDPPDRIDEVSNPKGPAFADWMLAVMGSAPGQRGVITMQPDTGRQTVTSLVGDKAERWVYWPNLGREYPQIFQFTTPNEMPENSRCGKVVFSDMHVSVGPAAGVTTYPESCGAATTLSPQEMALAFVFFDVASCVADVIL